MSKTCENVPKNTFPTEMHDRIPSGIENGGSVLVQDTLQFFYPRSLWLRKDLFFLFFLISLAIMIPEKKSKHYRQYIKVGRDIATAKKPITAGPEIKYITKRKGKKHLTCSTLLVRLEILWSYILSKWF